MLTEAQRGALRFRLGKLPKEARRRHPAKDVVALLDSLDEMQRERDTWKARARKCR